MFFLIMVLWYTFLIICIQQKLFFVSFFTFVVLIHGVRQTESSSILRFGLLKLKAHMLKGISSCTSILLVDSVIFKILKILCFFLHPYIFLPTAHKVAQRQNCPYIKLYVYSGSANP